MTLIPATGARLSWHGIVARAAPRMATNDPTKDEPSAAERTVKLQRLGSVGGAGRREAAAWWQERRKQIAIERHEPPERQR